MCVYVASPLPRCAHGGVVVCSSSDAVIDEKSYVKSMRSVAICASSSSASQRRIAASNSCRSFQATALLDASVGGEVHRRAIHGCLQSMPSCLALARHSPLNQLFEHASRSTTRAPRTQSWVNCVCVGPWHARLLFLGAAAGEAYWALALADVWIAVLPSV